MAETIMAWIGCVAVALAGLACAATAWEKSRAKGFARGYDAGYQHFKNCLSSTAHWFGEDPATLALLSDLAQDRDATYTIRDRWRENRKARAALLLAGQEGERG